MSLYARKLVKTVDDARHKCMKEFLNRYRIDNHDTCQWC